MNGCVSTASGVSSVITHMCSAGISATLPPARRASSDVHRPAARTTVSASMSPPEVASPVTAPRSPRRKPVTVVPGTYRTPRSTAPFAKASAANPGLTVPSPGYQVPPTRSSTARPAHSSRIPSGSTIRTSMPWSRAIDTPASSSSIRAWVRAMPSDPFRRSPVSMPVSSPSRS